MSNEGKRFEQDFINSVPEHIFRYRFKDGTAGFAGQKNENGRFQAKNMCDFMLYHKKLFLLELKSHKGKSFPFSCIRENQLEELSKAQSFVGIIPGIVFNFRDLERTYFVNIHHVHYYYYHAERKSFPLDFIQQWGLPIEGYKKRTRYSYDIETFIEELEGYHDKD